MGIDISYFGKEKKIFMKLGPSNKILKEKSKKSAILALGEKCISFSITIEVI